MKHIILYIIVLIALSSCKKFDYFQENPNRPTATDPSLLLTNIERVAFSTISADAALASRQLVYTQGNSTAQYYNWNRSSMGYSNIAQAVRMEQEAARVNKHNYRYLAKFFKSYFIVAMTQTFGDIPYSKMMQSIENNNFSDSSATRPVYDKQRDIYIQVLKELKIASDSLGASSDAITGDVVYNGSINAWKKLINSFTLRVLMSLSKKEADSELGIKQRFNEIVSNPTQYPLINTNSENGRLPYYDINGNRYPYYNNNSMKTDYYLDSSFVDILQNLNDPRLFTYGQPAGSVNTTTIKDFSKYDGLVGSALLSYNTGKKGRSQASPINRRYAYEIVNEPSLLIGNSEVQFLLAEAVIRGWITGNANDFYKNGIRASLQFSNFTYPAATGVAYNGQLYTTDEINNYLAQPIINLQAGKEIEQIITQKYISLFMNTGWQAFYEQRRTGYPVFETVFSGVLNNKRIPKRWMYPLDEQNYNGINLEAAIKSQYPNGDDINGVMWLIQ
ncbi:SusD/RagB family nutrient-binding outer membrane lipoprotein [Niabella yanshanensis]|uniref:SusD/RagB family nutrient-binding outer membrane lipoprotein n=1 Tax=Niabella yanshanensis TaxID=577386 RepID=A0ABZ0W1Q4_9BACT|nr:SusD/RagB family nutrient-binding outer membrane lipoprotein [Niabella yanshanensis]WQD37188.1 SusD/RagB family nutrient-binding outer membrane lipoprotein [Niabella yanshanensis]